MQFKQNSQLSVLKLTKTVKLPLKDGVIIQKAKEKYVPDNYLVVDKEFQGVKLTEQWLMFLIIRKTNLNN